MNFQVPKKVGIFGSTGSIGKNAINIIANNPDKFEVEVLTAENNYELLAAQAILVDASRVVIANQNHYFALKSLLSDTNIEVQAGRTEVEQAALLEVDFALIAISCINALGAAFNACRSARSVGFANKESLVCAGPILLAEAAKSGAKILPVDSEHSAIYQVLNSKQGLKKIILTASGGPFRNYSLEEMANVTKEQALKHPNWDMGPKVTIDSATLVNKGLEIIEASYLFGLDGEKIDVIIHSESIIHSMVEYEDGSILAQMGRPNMAVPIAYAMNYPERLSLPDMGIDLAMIARLSFEPLDNKRFRGPNLAYAALKKGLSAQIALNSSNEKAAQLFLEGEITYLAITDLIEEALNNEYTNPQTISEVLDLDFEIKTKTEEKAKKLINA